MSDTQAYSAAEAQTYTTAYAETKQGQGIQQKWFQEEGQGL